MKLIVKYSKLCHNMYDIFMSFRHSCFSAFGGLDTASVWHRTAWERLDKKAKYTHASYSDHQEIINKNDCLNSQVLFSPLLFYTDFGVGIVEHLIQLFISLKGIFEMFTG